MSVFHTKWVCGVAGMLGFDPQFWAENVRNIEELNQQGSGSRAVATGTAGQVYVLKTFGNPATKL